MPRHLKWTAFSFIFLANIQLHAQGFAIGKDTAIWEEISEAEKLKASLLWLKKRALKEEIKKATIDLLKHAATYNDVYTVLRISNWDSGMMRTIPSLVPIRQAKIIKFKISSGFGYRKHPLKNNDMFHGGIDIPAPNGTPVYAVADAVVISAVKFHSSLGNFVQLNHLNGFITLYGHLLRFIVLPGQTVKQGQVIGYVGQSGWSTGPHLHYILIKNGFALDPYPFCFLMFEKFRAKEKPVYSGSSK
ncbi:hypothetical protein AAE02nite_31700 [Adhaeribacter aerolatus]|uniref:M23ase beta-sheet core domain-containing protein n=1 Tax=Adhaeribacter aerolatus TaxID=670289 RepID=A0A512B0L4_9BACT|nr:M23 family metallopeptidase [Adhaeribacter aerolatus]GEO05506.1 hypothetical protein AAE02nite_31700 [Adhaeribacter aerolatus]